ncbi:MAG: ABC transporter permease [Vicinamibacterales bacterium]
MGDVRFALRQLSKSLGFTVTAVFTLALGFCASLAIVAFADAALVQPLPYPGPDRLAGVFERVPLFPRSNLSYLDYLDWKRLNTVFSSLAAYQGGGATLSTSSGAVEVTGARVSADFLRTLGVTPVLGRDFRDGEDLPSAAGTVILSYDVWQSRFGGKTDVLGQRVTLNDEPSVVIGVLPKDFTFAPVEPADFWMPLQPAGHCEARRGCHNLYGVGRLKDGVSLEAASANVAAIAATLERQYPDSNRGQGSVVVPLSDVIVGRVRAILLALLGGAVLLLVIAVTNVAGLVLVRADARRREIAVRSALGASRGRIVWQFAAEASALVGASAALGIAGASVCIRLLAALVPPDMAARLPFLRGVGLHAHVWAFAVIVCGLAVALFALTPLAQLSIAGGAAALAEGSRGSAGRTWSRLGGKLVVVELALAMVLIAGGALLARSLYGLLHVNVGMAPDHVAMIGVNVPRSYQGNAQIVALQRRVRERLESLPGVESVGTTSTRPIQGGNTNWIQVAGRPYHGEHNEVNGREIDDGYFRTIRARMLRGRGIEPTDDASKRPVVVVNQALVRKYFPDQDPIGQKLLYSSRAAPPPLQIVGVVDDIKESPLDATTAPTMYTAFAQDPDHGFWLFVRTSQAEESLLPTLAFAIHELDPDLATFGGNRLTHMIDDSEPAYLRRSGAWLVGSFAALAWLLGVVGLYGVVAYSVGQRTREIGVRMALGAQRGSVARLIVGEAARVVGIGLIGGALAAIGAATMVRSLLFGVSAWDAPTLAAAAAILGASALLASYVPARRAASLNPVEALRAD